MLVAIGPRPALLARDATRTLPIVAVPVDDPVQMGLADSYARPGRNITGLSGAYHGLLSRRLQLLKDLVPDARRVGILMNPYTVPRADAREGRGGRYGASSAWRSWCSRRAGPRTSTPRWRRWRATGWTAC